MAHFRGTLQGQKGEASCLGTKVSGLIANLDGWTTGVMVKLNHDPATGNDVVKVFRTGGSDEADKSTTLMATWEKEAKEKKT